LVPGSLSQLDQEAVVTEHLEDRQSALAEQMAVWLEELGLDEQLREAGLPTFVRSDDGSVTWYEAGGVELLTAERLELLSTSLRSQGDEPQHAVPVALVLLARKARLRAALSAEQEPGYERVAALRGESVNATRFAVHKAKA